MSLQVRFLLEQMYGKHTQRHTQPHKKEERETHRDTHMVRLVKIKLRHSNRSNTHLIKPPTLQLNTEYNEVPITYFPELQ